MSEVQRFTLAERFEVKRFRLNAFTKRNRECGKALVFSRQLLGRNKQRQQEKEILIHMVQPFKSHTQDNSLFLG